eukprot:scaffold172387_cov30-Tisochrysis_lutea.AAC.1
MAGLSCVGVWVWVSGTGMSEGVKSAGSHRQAVAGCKWYVVCELEWAWIWSPASSSRMKRVLCECVCVKYWQPPAVSP